MGQGGLDPDASNALEAEGLHVASAVELPDGLLAGSVRTSTLTTRRPPISVKLAAGRKPG